MGRPDFLDLHRLDEDRRIKMIGDAVMRTLKCAFVIDDDNEKIDRYLAKLKKRFPAVVVDKRIKGPVKGAVTITLTTAGADQN